MLGYPIHHLLQRAVVLRTFNRQITSCPATTIILNDFLSVMPFCGSIEENWKFRRKCIIIDQQSGNPLMLLGQYSDDEFHEEAADHTSVDNSSSYDNNKASESKVTKYKEIEASIIEDLSAQSVKQHDLEKNSVSPDVSGNPEGNSDCCPIDAGDSGKDVYATGTTDVQVFGDVGSGWKIVMHEASDRYYYWNIETGETSWEVPNAVAVETGLIKEPEPSILDEDMDPSSAITATDVSKESQKISDECQLELLEANNPNGISHELKSYIPSEETSLFGSSLASEQPSDSLLNESLHRIGFEGANAISNEDMVEGSDHANSVVKYGEYLLERLKSLKGSLGQFQGQMSKYILEVEIRLSDCKSLLLYGPSLLPFWMHSEIQLKRLENCINNNICQRTDPAKTNEVEKSDDLKGETKVRPSVGDECAAEGNEKKVISVVSSQNGVVHTAALISHNEVHGNDTFAEHISSRNPETIDPASGAEKTDELNMSPNNVKSTPKPDLEDGEVDMDVDMEVDDEHAGNNTSVDDVWGGNDTALSQPPAQQYPPENFPFFASEDGFAAPPLPDEEWIPPPPPDNEPIPPPPPDEPPQTSYPTLPYPEAVQHPSYTDQYNISYPDSNFHYYTPAVTEVPSNLFGHVEESQICVPHPPVSYQTVSNIYPSTTPSSVEPVVYAGYYDLQDGKVPLFPVASEVRSSEFHSPYTQAGPQTYASLASNSNMYIAAPTAISHSSSPAEKEVFSNGGVGVASTASVNAPVMNSLKESDVANSAAPPTTKSTATATVTATATAVQSKALRGKKRPVAVVPTMRSNKKVSSLVDKWKAAKEEMHEDEEDEPENALEALEKKKQREIEQWRAQQIASGEAKDNANFQPLGCDWRERVKRRKAQLARAANRSPPEAAEQNQQPDLIELSKDLPSGWQAYYDESSKKVYYGNAITSDTSWTRPTK